MPLVAAAVCPHPPLIVPEIAGRAAPELADLRAACGEAIARLPAAEPDAVVVIGDGPTTGPVRPPYRASFAPWGLPLTIGTEGRPLPLSLAIGHWLMDAFWGRSGGPSPALHAVAPSAAVGECATLGERLAEGAQRMALLVMGDGSACRGGDSPAGHDPRAELYDKRVACALASADSEALLALDPAVSAELRVAGRAPWQVLAGAARASGEPWRAELPYDGAPYGVAYFVACWGPA